MLATLLGVVGISLPSRYLISVVEQVYELVSYTCLLGFYIGLLVALNIYEAFSHRTH